MSMQKKMSNQKGVAIILALITITILSVLVGELMYETALYKRIVANNIDQLQAKNLTRIGLKLARLQILGTRKAKQKIKEFGKNLPIKAADVELIWRTPLLLPPPLPGNASLVLKSEHGKFTDALGLNGNLSVHIVGESQKLNINRLVWLVKAKKKKDDDPNKTEEEKKAEEEAANKDPEEEEKTEEELLEIFRKTMIDAVDELLAKKREDDEDFYEKYDSISGKVIIGNLLAWVDPNTIVDGDGSQADAFYLEQTPPYHIKKAPLYSMSELNLIKGFDDELTNFISEYFTTVLTEGINVNQVDSKLIQALFPSISDDDLEKFEERRTDLPFEDVDEFWKYMNEELGFEEEDKEEIDESGLLFVTEETAFRVVIEARSGDARKLWVASLGVAPPTLVRKDETEDEKAARLKREKEKLEKEQEQEEKGQEDQVTVYDTDAPKVLYLRTD